MKTPVFSPMSKHRVLLMSTAALLVSLPQAHAVENLTTPSGEAVTAGSATFDRPAEGQLNVNQSSHRAVINWDSFNIGEKAKTEFFQPGSPCCADR